MLKRILGRRFLAAMFVGLSVLFMTACSSTCGMSVATSQSQSPNLSHNVKIADGSVV